MTTSEAAEAAAKREAAEAERTMRRRRGGGRASGGGAGNVALSLLRSRVEKLEQELDERQASERRFSRASRRWASGWRARMCEKLQGELAAQFEHAARQTKALRDA